MAREIPWSYIEQYSKALNTISEEARKKVSRALSRLDYSLPVADVREAVIAILQPACGASADMAARLAAEFYNGLSLRMTGEAYDAEAESLRNPDATSGAVRAFAQELVEGNDSDFIGKCVDRVDYETRRAANECVAYNAKKDPRKPKWARIPTGAETCEWCIMLASRGFVYHSEETASHAHAHCDCRIVPGWGEKPSVDGYDPDKYYDMWKQSQSQEARTENQSDDNEQTVRSSEERKKLFDEWLAARDKASELRKQMREESDPDKKEALRAQVDKAEAATNAAQSKMTNGEFLIERARVYPISTYLKPEKWGKIPSTAEIVDILGGGDKTKGSCSSLAFAYFGNKGGDVVRDFRGGTSREFFSTLGYIKDITKIDGVDSHIESDKNAYTAAHRAMEHVEEGKRYYFCAGKHAAVVEKRDGSAYYLELQMQTGNGWHELTDGALKNRFGCTKTMTAGGIKLDQDVIIIDGDTLSRNAEFKELMGYINTQESAQKKGVGGGAK